MTARIVTRDQAAALGAELRAQGKRIACVSGSFDLLHAGHVDLLERAKDKGDVLVVLLNSDRSVRAYKGKRRPLVPEKYRAEMLAALRSVDYVVIFDDLVPNAVLAELRPDVLVNGVEYGSESVEAATVAANGGTIALVDHRHPLSTSALVQRIIATASEPSSKAVFLDRDGTLIEDTGYPHRPEDVHWKEGAFEALRQLSNASYLLVLITNQSGVGRGMFSEEDVHAIHAHMRAELEKEGIKLAGIYYCPHHPDDGCTCRKPRVGMLLAAAEELDIALSSSWIIGDSCSDIQAGRFANVRTALLGAPGEMCRPGPQIQAQSLLEAANAILDWKAETQ